MVDPVDKRAVQQPAEPRGKKLESATEDGLDIEGAVEGDGEESDATPDVAAEESVDMQAPNYGTSGDEKEFVDNEMYQLKLEFSEGVVDEGRPRSSTRAGQVLKLDPMGVTPELKRVRAQCKDAKARAHWPPAL